MRKIILVLCLMPIVANAAIPYRTEQSSSYNEGSSKSEEFAKTRRFYIGGSYNLAMWQDGADKNFKMAGDNTSSFDVMAGVRVYDTFRLEANYYNLDAKWGNIGLTGNTIFVNAIFDARVDSLYRLFYNQRLVPYVGFGAGASWNSVSGAQIQDDVSPVAAVITGLGVEMGDRFALDIGYRYFYMFSPKFDVINDFAPISHQFRLGARLNF